MIQWFYFAPLGLVGLYILILCPFYVHSDKQINKYTGQRSCFHAYFMQFSLFWTLRIDIKWPSYSIIDRIYKMTRNKTLCQKPLASQWSEALLWTMFLMWSPMFSWWTALRHHSDNQKENEVTGTSTCVHAFPRMNNTVSACPSVSFTHTRTQIFQRELLDRVHGNQRTETGNCK